MDCLLGSFLVKKGVRKSDSVERLAWRVVSV